MLLFYSSTVDLIWYILKMNYDSVQIIKSKPPEVKLTPQYYDISDHQDIQTYHNLYQINTQLWRLLLSNAHLH